MTLCFVAMHGLSTARRSQPVCCTSLVKAFGSLWLHSGRAKCLLRLCTLIIVGDAAQLWLLPAGMLCLRYSLSWCLKRDLNEWLTFFSISPLPRASSVHLYLLHPSPPPPLYSDVLMQHPKAHHAHVIHPPPGRWHVVLCHPSLVDSDDQVRPVGDLVERGAASEAAE